MTDNKETIFEQNKRNFLAYADKLFTHVLPPEPKSMALQKINLKNELECGILYELFNYGFKRKIFDFTKAEDAEIYKKSLLNDAEEMFKFVSDYLKATGYYPILQKINKDSNGNVTGFDMQFKEV